MSRHHAHSLCSPSSRYRWRQCPGSVWKTPRAEDVPSAAAKEGIIAHELLQHSLESDLSPDEWVKRWKRYRPHHADMVRDTYGHVDSVRPLDRVVAEWRPPDPGGLLSYATGTADAVVWRGATGAVKEGKRTNKGVPHHVEIWDLKTGVWISKKVWVASLQIACYAVGLREWYREPIRIKCIVSGPAFVVPRCILDLDEDKVQEEKRKIEEEVQAVLMAKDAPEDHLHPSPDACGWCPARDFCRARMEFEVERM